MSKEIYKEYFNIEIEKGFKGNDYLYDNKELTDVDSWLNGLFVPEDFNLFTRKPKTQMINGHEVVAPRYDLPERDAQCFWINSIASATSGYAKCSALSLAEHEKLSLSENGWFDNEKDVIAYANAHRENKQL